MEYMEPLNICVLMLQFLGKPALKGHWDEPMIRDPGMSITNSFPESVYLKFTKPQYCHSLALKRVVLRITSRRPGYLRSTLSQFFLLHLQRMDQLPELAHFRV